MKINKDLIDAVMMVSFIMLVLIGTTDFESVTTKNVVMGAVGLLAAIMVTLRVVQVKQEAKLPRKEYEY